MGTRLTHFDFNAAFARTQNPVVLNYLPVMTADQRARNQELTTTMYSQTDVFSNEPSCDCGSISGAYNEGVICQDCGTPVQDRMIKELEFKSWFRSPVGVERLISPLVWVKLLKRFRKDNFAVFRWISNPDYIPPKDVPAETISKALELGIPRGYNNMVRNLLLIYDTIFQSEYFNARKESLEQDELRTLIATKPHLVLTNYLPLPNKTLIVREQTASSKEWSDELTINLIDVIKTVTGIDSDSTRFTLKQLEARTAKAIDMLGSSWYTAVISDFISKKTGLARKHIFGLRCHFSARGVISSQTGVHRYGTILLPWAIALSLFKEHLVSVLLRRQNPNTGFLYTPNEAIGLLQNNTDTFNPILGEILDSFIEYAPDNLIPIFLVRNPTLGRPSTESQWIAGFKKDPSDVTISLSILNIIGFNADFDGDAMALMLLLDSVMTKMAEGLLPHKNYVSVAKPYQLSGIDNLPKPIGLNLVKFINQETTPYNSPAELPPTTCDFLKRLRSRVPN